MKTLSDKINESLKESYTERDESINSLIDVIEILYADYFTGHIDTLDREREQIRNSVKYQIAFQNNLTNFDSFKEAVISTVHDYNNKMESIGQNKVSAVWKQNGQTDILELY